MLLTTLKDVSANQRLGGRSVCHISADSELAAYRFLFFLLQKDVPSGYLVFYGFIGKGQIEYLRYCFLFDIECEAVVNLHLFSINEREAGGVFYSFDELFQCGIANAERKFCFSFLCLCL